MPRRFFTSGRKFSTTTSALAARRRKTATPSGDLRSNVIPRLLRCRFWKSGPWRGPPAGSPTSKYSGTSTLITFAPQSASWRTQVGPARTRLRSRTVKRARAAEACGTAMPTTGINPRGRSTAAPRRTGPRGGLDGPEQAAPTDLTGQLAGLRFDRVASRRPGHGRKPARIGGFQLGAQRGIETRRLVADQRQRAAGAKRRGGLHVPDGRVDPVERLGRDHHVEGPIGAAPGLEGDLLDGDLGERSHLPAQDRGHVAAGLEGDDRVPAPGERQRRLAGARADLEDPSPGRNPAPRGRLVDERLGVGRTRGVVQLRAAIEGRPGGFVDPGHGCRKVARETSLCGTGCPAERARRYG